MDMVPTAVILTNSSLSDSIYYINNSRYLIFLEIIKYNKNLANWTKTNQKTPPGNLRT